MTVISSATTISTTQTGDTVVSGGTLTVASGGAAVTTTVSSSGALVLQAGGTASNTVVSNGGLLLGSGIDSATTVNSGGHDYVFAGGVARGTILNSGSVQFVLYGGAASGATLVSGGEQFIFSSGVASGTIVSNGSFELVELGGVTSGGVLSSGGLLGTSGRAVGVTDSGILEVLGGGTASHTIVAAGGSEIVTLNGNSISTTIDRGGTQVVAAGTSFGAIVNSGGFEVVAAAGSATSATVNAGGVLEIVIGSSLDTVVNGGLEFVGSSSLSVSATIGAGGVEVVQSDGAARATTIAGGVLELEPGAITSGGVLFTGSGGVMKVDGASAIPASSAVLSGFAPGESINLAFVTSAADDSFTAAGDTLTVTAGGTSYVFTVDGAGDESFQLSAATDGSLIVEAAVCYYPGTGIRTPSGDVAVESLKIADDLVLADGRVMPVRWIGRNTVSTRFADPLRVSPIRIKADALADGLPGRDLLVSPQHAVRIDAILIQAGALVNGLSIIRESDVPETFIYYHIEMPEHALILAEGVAAESFVDNVSRMAFDNWDEHETLYGDAPITEMASPRAQSHRQVPVEIHARLNERAAMLFGSGRSVAA
ncbi:Hint domain-containing protein [Acidisoma cellulosilytica]|uniref:Hint domain-containing protein n=1 Tax=Acidisoma cellulosilyticum TaxID=2802395 RepID=A0A963Z8U5_9PROT|nr:Hint domain-containing protein [Acidisoma cellulosilyticum]MCB8883992.1 Hint domain-containing protein [Acidisoma cellulosilyticum]